MMDGEVRENLRRDLSRYNEASYCIRSQDTGELLEEWVFHKYYNGTISATQRVYEIDLDSGFREVPQEYCHTFDGTLNELCDKIEEREMYC
jgi:hypothetical protein